VAAPADVFRSSAGESYSRLVAQGKSNREAAAAREGIRRWRIRFTGR